MIGRIPLHISDICTGTRVFNGYREGLQAIALDSKVYIGTHSIALASLSRLYILTCHAYDNAGAIARSTRARDRLSVPIDQILRRQMTHGDSIVVSKTRTVGAPIGPCMVPSTPLRRRAKRADVCGTPSPSFRDGPPTLAIIGSFRTFLCDVVWSWYTCPSLRISGSW